MKQSKDYKRGFLKAVSLLKSIQHKDFDWYAKTFGTDGADCEDYARWIKSKLKSRKGSKKS